MKIRIEQIAILPGTAVVTGRPVNDGTKVVAAEADVAGAMLMAIAMQESDEPMVVDVPDWAIRTILELPPEA